MSDGIEIKLPESISNWIFDLHDATRRSLRSEDVKALYEVEYKELTDKYFSQSAWPVSKVVAPECSQDEQFLIFYNELRTRHIFTALKTQLAELTLADFTESWNNYIAVSQNAYYPSIGTKRAHTGRASPNAPLQHLPYDQSNGIISFIFLDHIYFLSLSVFRFLNLF